MVGSMFVPAGSVVVTNPDDNPIPISGHVTVSGTVTIGDVAGSVAVTNFTVLGSSRVVENFDDLGSSRVVTNFGDLGSDRTGSFAITTTVLPVSGTLFQDVLGSVRVTNQLDILEDSVSAVGSIHTGSATLVAGDWGGSNAVVRMDVGSYVLVAGSISSIPLGSESVITAGSVEVYQGTATDLNADIIGSVAISNFTAIGSSVVVTNFGDLGSDRTGSMAITTTVLPVSGTLFQDILGSVAISNQISVEQESIAAVGSQHLGSATLIGGDWGGSLAVTRMDIGSYMLVAGSVSSMPIIGISGTVVGVSGIVNQGTSPWVVSGTATVSGVISNRVAGSIVNLPNVTINSPETIGSIAIQDVSVLGSIVIGSVSAHVDAVYIQSGANMLGSVGVTNLPDVVQDSTVRQISAGSVTITEISAGSVEVFQTTNSDLQVQATQETSPWVVSGTATVDNRVAGSIVDWPGSLAVSNFAALGSSRVLKGVGSVLGLFTDSSNSLDSPLVANGSYLMVAGSISSMPSVTATNESVAKPGTAGLGSMAIIAGFSGGVAMPLVTTAGSVLLVTGSVRQAVTPWSISGTVRADILTDPVPMLGSVKILSSTGSLEVYQTTNADMQVQATQETSPWVTSGQVTVEKFLAVGSVVISGTSIPVSRGIGSVLGLFTDSSNTLDSPLVANGSYLMIAGSISSMPSVTATNESVAEEGTAHLGSATIIAGASGGITMPLLTTAGSVLITTGSVNQNTDPWRVTGSMSLFDLGSTAFVTAVGGSVEVFQDTNSDMQVQATQEGTWNINNLTTGSVRIVSLADTGRQITAGSVTITEISAGSVEVFQTTNADLQVQATQETDPWIVLGSVRSDTIGSVRITSLADTTREITAGSVILLSNAGSIPVYSQSPPLETEQVRGDFFSSGGTVHTSGTAAVIYTPGAGSKALLKGFTASADLATHFRLIFSGGTATHVGEWTLPNSGTVAMNLIGMEPSGAVNQPVSVGLFNAGSIHVTVFGRDTL